MRISERRLQNAAWLLHVEPEALREALNAHPLTARNEAIVAAYRETPNLQRVGEQFGISGEYVRQIVVRHERRTGEAIPRGKGRPRISKSVVVRCVDCGRERRAMPSELRPVERCLYCTQALGRKLSNEQIESAIRRVLAGGVVRPKGSDVRLTHWGAIAEEYGLQKNVHHNLPRAAFLYLQHHRRYSEIDALWPVLPRWLSKYARPRMMEAAE